MYECHLCLGLFSCKCYVSLLLYKSNTWKWQNSWCSCAIQDSFVTIQYWTVIKHLTVYLRYSFLYMEPGSVIKVNKNILSQSGSDLWISHSFFLCCKSCALVRGRVGVHMCLCLSRNVGLCYRIFSGQAFYIEVWLLWPGNSLTYNIAQVLLHCKTIVTIFYCFRLGTDYQQFPWKMHTSGNSGNIA